jgi:hypothetical protein
MTNKSKWYLSESNKIIPPVKYTTFKNCDRLHLYEHWTINLNKIVSYNYANITLLYFFLIALLSSWNTMNAAEKLHNSRPRRCYRNEYAKYIYILITFSVFGKYDNSVEWRIKPLWNCHLKCLKNNISFHDIY